MARVKRWAESERHERGLRAARLDFRPAMCER
jgi:hypothetical protein